MELMIEMLGSLQQLPLWDEASMALMGTVLLVIGAVMRKAA